MPRRFPEWAASGARLGVPVELYFTEDPYVETVPESVQAKFNNQFPCFRVEVPPDLNSTFVSERGEERVSFLGGGYSMERASWLDKNNTTDSDRLAATPKPRFLLRFWIDCISGAKRRDVELKPSTLIIGTIPIWDDPHQIARLERELAASKASIREKQQNGSRQDEDAPTNPNAAADGKSSFLRKCVSYFRRPKEKKRGNDNDESSPEYRQEQLERLLPFRGCSKADKGIITAPTGSLVIPYLEEDISMRKQQHKFLLLDPFP